MIVIIASREDSKQSNLGLHVFHSCFIRKLFLNIFHKETYCVKTRIESSPSFLLTDLSELFLSVSNVHNYSPSCS